MRTIKERKRRCERVVATAAAVGCVAAMTSCRALSVIPVQDAFAPLPTLVDGGQAVVRLYNAPIQGIEGIATHPWFVVRSADSTVFDRWEVWQTAGGPYGHVRKNRAGATADVGAGGTYVIAELAGAEAEAVVAFIERRSPFYSCKDTYVLLGPNSNTFAQWVLDGTGWAVELPPTAIGKDAPASCP